ncbi:MerR family transcriptional regulator [Streptomyces sp. NPDC005388]|uniref:MerR family transcriptional regulator n=1 Tax=Streptomyces sp. NPDC005388 TaxID=3156717 RepID=UPI0033B9F366
MCSFPPSEGTGTYPYPSCGGFHGQRDYPDEALERVQLIQDLFAAGLSSRTVVELLPCVSTGVATPAMLNQLIIERDRIAARIQDLTRAKTKLGRVIENVTAANVAQD